MKVLRDAKVALPLFSASLQVTVRGYLLFAACLALQRMCTHNSGR